MRLEAKVEFLIFIQWAAIIVLVLAPVLRCIEEPYPRRDQHNLLRDVDRLWKPGHEPVAFVAYNRTRVHTSV
jgi:hypothetical protein